METENNWGASRFYSQIKFFNKVQGKEALGDYNQNEDYKNIKGLYTWFFNSNKLKITETGISGQFSITGTDGYYEIDVFSVKKTDTQ